MLEVFHLLQRNLNFIIEDKTNNNFKGEGKYEKIAKWIKSIFNYYYFDSYIENNQKKQNEQLTIYSKKDFENDSIKYFNDKPKETVNHLIEIKYDEKFPEIILIY